MSAFGTVMKAGKVALAVWGVVASVRHLGKVLVELRKRDHTFYIDVGDLPPEKVTEHMAEVGRRLARDEDYYVPTRGKSRFR